MVADVPCAMMTSGSFPACASGRNRRPRRIAPCDGNSTSLITRDLRCLSRPAPANIGQAQLAKARALDIESPQVRLEVGRTHTPSLILRRDTSTVLPTAPVLSASARPHRRPSVARPGAIPHVSGAQLRLNPRVAHRGRTHTISSVSPVPNPASAGRDCAPLGEAQPTGAKAQSLTSTGGIVDVEPDDVTQPHRRTSLAGRGWR